MTSSNSSTSDLPVVPIVTDAQYYDFGVKDNTIDYNQSIRNKPTGLTTSWGSITGTLSSQTDLQTALNAKADKTTTITAGTWLSGGGDLSANRTINLANTAVTPGSYSTANITVDAQGRITSASNWTGSFPWAVAVYTYTNAGQSIAQNTYVPINFDQEKYDTSSMHDNVTNNTRITFPSTWYYQVIWQVKFPIQSVGTNCNLILQKNWAAYYSVSTRDAPTNSWVFTFQVSALVDANASDYVELIVYNTFGWTVNLTTSTGDNYFNAYRVF